MPFLPKMFGRNQDFQGSVWGEVTFQSAWVESEFEFSDFCLEGSLIFKIHNVRRHYRHKNFKNFSMVESVSNSNLPMLWHYSWMLANLNENPWKSGLWGEVTFENAGEKSLWGGIKIFRFSKGRDQNFENFKRGGTWKKFGVEETRRRWEIFKAKWGEPKFSSWL